MKALTIILFISSLNACMLRMSSQYTITQTQSLSREQTTIVFSATNKTYNTTEEVGGEQINSTTIMAKANETYIIEVKPNNTNLNFTIDGKFLHVGIIDFNKFKKIVTTSQATEIILSFTAHPDSSRYELIITKS